MCFHLKWRGFQNTLKTLYFCFSNLSVTQMQFIFDSVPLDARDKHSKNHPVQQALSLVQMQGHKASNLEVPQPQSKRTHVSADLME